MQRQVTSNFDLWMSKGAHDIFAFVINDLGFDKQPKQVIIGLFESTKTNSRTLAKILTKLFGHYGL